MISAYKPHLKVTRHHRLQRRKRDRGTHKKSSSLCEREKFKLKQIVKKYIFVIMRSNIIKIKDYFPQRKTMTTTEELLRLWKNVSGALKNIKIIFCTSEKTFFCARSAAFCKDEKEGNKKKKREMKNGH
jgi:hypothetical protein